MNILCIRHGESIGNEKDIIQGHTDFNLTEKGIKQAEELKNTKDLFDGDISQVYSSDLIRAIETANIAFPSQDIIKTTKLREQDFGSAVGSLDSFLNANPEYRLNEPEAFERPFPNGECIMDVYDRTKDIFDEIISENNNQDNIIIVSHFTVLICIFAIASSESVSNIWPRKHFENGDIIHIKYSDDEFDILGQYAYDAL